MKRRKNASDRFSFSLCSWCSSSSESSSLFPFLCFSSLFFSFMLSRSPSLPPPSLHAVVCRHAGISGPQNDRPNLTVLAPVTKDGRYDSVCACDWSRSQLLFMWLVIKCLSTLDVVVSSMSLGSYVRDRPCFL